MPSLARSVSDSPQWIVMTPPSPRASLSRAVSPSALERGGRGPIVGDIRPLLSPRRFLPRYGTARITPCHRAAILPESVGVVKRQQLLGRGPGHHGATPGRRPLGLLAGDVTTGARRGARAGRRAGETQRTRARDRSVRPAARGGRGCVE